MKNLVFGVLFVFSLHFVVPAHAQDNTSHHPEEIQPLVKSFEVLAERNNPDSSAIIDRDLKKLKQIYVHSDEMIKKFDQDLEAYVKDPVSNPDPMTTQNYQDLRIYYSLHKSTTERVVEFYNYLNTVAENKSLQSDLKGQHARFALDQFNLKIKKLGVVDSIALQEVFHKIGKKDALLKASELSDRIESNAYKNALAEKKSVYSRIINEYGGSLNQEFNTIKTVSNIFQAQPQQAKPMSINVRPGADNLGWLNGGNFPANHWALTYDDGPNAHNTPIIRQTLDQYGVKATFFWLSQITSQPAYQGIINDVKASGHELANHSHSHANLQVLGEGGLQQEIVSAQALHSGAYGAAPKYFRCPYGNCGSNGSRIRQLIADQGMIMVLWNVDSLDWQDHNPASVINRIRQQMAARGAGIVLMHDIQAVTVEVTRQLIPQLVQEGQVKFVTMPQIVGILNQ